ncbi:MAG: urease accessory protein [Alphaproteobacteria bacterium]|nr:urease accessory protein [Alphaproteobacteria bacterium]
MSGATAREQSDVFAANRAVGRVAFAVAAMRGTTGRTRVDEQGSLRVRFLRRTSTELEAVLVNSAGGVTGGDRFDLDISVGAGARLVVSTAAAEKIYRSLGADAEVSVRLKVDREGSLLWLPQEAILFDQARLRRDIEIDLAADAKVMLAEALIFGRTASGEAMQNGSLTDRWRVRRDGKLIFAETLKLDGAIAAKLQERAVAGAGVAVATIFMSPAGDAEVSGLRAIAESFRSELGVSSWNGLAVARLVAEDGATLRHDLALAMTALGASLPRPWLN